ncbi:MAG: transcription termination factor Rho [Puniceicoccales bacterium]|jgi:transcription termination factor Rho|nr:transcription termination factor Rho [Puniceicoccales bacterium]
MESLDCTFPVEGLFRAAGGNTPARLLDLSRNGKMTGNDILIPLSLVQKLRLRTGQYISGEAANAGNPNQRRLVRINAIDGLPIDRRRFCMPFQRATTTSPEKMFHLETGTAPLSTRIIDFFVPIGRGQRCMIVAPPKTGKTILLQQIARGILQNHGDCHLMVLLVDERPEEVTDFKRNAPVEIFASSNDEAIKTHIEVAQLAFARAENLVETGRHVVLLLDSLTRLARAINNNLGRGAGRTMTGGLDPQALERARQFFSLARNTEEIGSLTIIATALIETGSRMDEAIFQELKGTGNCEIILDRKLAERRIFPAINIPASSTRREELLLGAKELQLNQLLRRSFVGLSPEDAMEGLVNRLSKTASNREFMDFIAKR